MSTFSCPVVRLGKIGKHPGADSLSITQVEGGPCIIRTGDFQEGDCAIYVPVESVVPLDNQAFAFLRDPKRPDRKTLRIKAKKLRGIFSMGLLIPVSVLDFEGTPVDASAMLGVNVAERLGVVKYEEPESTTLGGQNEKDPGFMPVYEIESYRKYKHLLVPGEEVYLSEKIHGTNSRFGFRDGRLWVGSHRCVKRQDPNSLWWKIAAQYQLEEKLSRHPDYVFYGETYGQIQDLKYGARQGECSLAIFDIFDSVTGRFLDYNIFLRVCESLGLPRVPVLFVGPYSEALEALADGKTTVPGADHIREGFVIKPTAERWDYKLGRVIMKLVSQDYLLRSGGTEHQ